MNLFQTTVISHLPNKQKMTPSGWQSFNAVCCIHNGESQDKRKRGGVMLTPNGGIRYHCFNCNFSTGWEPGTSLSKKFTSLLRWIGVNDTDLGALKLETLKYGSKRKDIGPKTKIKVNFKTKKLPKDTKTFDQLLSWRTMTDGNMSIDDMDKVIYYAVAARKLTQDYQLKFLAYSPSKVANMNERLIIVFYYKDKVVGYTARAIYEGTKPKYITSVDPNYVFNLDTQSWKRQFVVVCEGPIDALTIDGVAVCTNTISKEKAELINSLNKRVIVVPDANKPGIQLMKDAVKYGWNISYPPFLSYYIDINSASEKLDPVDILKQIIDNEISSDLKKRILIREKEKLYIEEVKKNVK